MNRVRMHSKFHRVGCRWVLPVGPPCGQQVVQEGGLQERALRAAMAVLLVHHQRDMADHPDIS
jgi:hypothetical protein